MSHDDEMFAQQIFRSTLVAVLALTGLGTYKILFFMHIVSVSTSGRFDACWDLISQMCRRDVGLPPLNLHR